MKGLRKVFGELMNQLVIDLALDNEIEDDDFFQEIIQKLVENQKEMLTHLDEVTKKKEKYKRFLFDFGVEDLSD